LLLRPPKIKAEIGTPLGSSHAESMAGFCSAGAVKRALGCATVFPLEASHLLPCQSIISLGTSLVIPSHHTSPSGVIPAVVKMVFLAIDFMALGLVFSLVPGATPK